jgi:hypothetical protein
MALETVVPTPPPTVLDPGPRACCRLNSGLRARHRHLLPQAVREPLPSTLTLPASECAATIDLDPASLGAHHRRPLPQTLDTASSEGDTPPLPHVTICANVNVNELS